MNLELLKFHRIVFGDCQRIRLPYVRVSVKDRATRAPRAQENKINEEVGDEMEREVDSDLDAAF